MKREHTILFLIRNWLLINPSKRLEIQQRIDIFINHINIPLTPTNRILHNSYQPKHYPYIVFHKYKRIYQHDYRYEQGHLVANQHYYESESLLVFAKEWCALHMWLFALYEWSWCILFLYHLDRSMYLFSKSIQNLILLICFELYLIKLINNDDLFN